MRYSARIDSVGNARRQQLRTARQLRTAQSPKERDARLQQLRTAREQTIVTEATEERQTRLDINIFSFHNHSKEMGYAEIHNPLTQIT